MPAYFDGAKKANLYAAYAKVNLNGALHKSKSTDNSRLIIALSAIGRDARCDGNYNLIKPFDDFNWIKKQGINGPIFALICVIYHLKKTIVTTQHSSNDCKRIH